MSRAHLFQRQAADLEKDPLDYFAFNVPEVFGLWRLFGFPFGIFSPPKVIQGFPLGPPLRTVELCFFSFFSPVSLSAFLRSATAKATDSGSSPPRKFSIGKIEHFFYKKLFLSS